MKKIEIPPYYNKPYVSDNWNRDKNTILEQVPPAVNQHAQEIERLQEKVKEVEKILEVEASEKQELKNEINELKEKIESLFMIMDVIELRENNWKPRRDNAPKTIAEIHEDAAKQKEEAEFLRRTSSSGGRNMPKMAERMSHSGSGRRDHKGMASASSGNDGWSTVGGGSSQRNKDKVGDLTKFGSVTRSKISSNVASLASLAPGGTLGSLGGAKGWSKDKGEGKAIGLNQTNSTSNIYSVLIPENSEGRKSSELSTLEKPSERKRKKIVLAPRTKAITPDEPAKSTASMPESVAARKINNTVAEYFSVLDIGEVILCFKSDIPKEYHAKAIESFANKVLEKKQKDVENVMKLFKEISSSVCNSETFKTGFKETLRFLIEIGEDAPLSYSFTGQLLFSSGLEFRDITKLLKPLDDDKAIEKIAKGYAMALKNDLNDEQKYVQKVYDFDIKSLFPKKNKDELNKFIEDLGVPPKK